jgi:hypothetical protein
MGRVLLGVQLRNTCGLGLSPTSQSAAFVSPLRAYFSLLTKISACFVCSQFKLTVTELGRACEVEMKAVRVAKQHIFRDRLLAATSTFTRRTRVRRLLSGQAVGHAIQPADPSLAPSTRRRYANLIGVAPIYRSVSLSITAFCSIYVVALVGP